MMSNLLFLLFVSSMCCILSQLKGYRFGMGDPSISEQYGYHDNGYHNRLTSTSPKPTYAYQLLTTNKRSNVYTYHLLTITFLSQFSFDPPTQFNLHNANHDCIVYCSFNTSPCVHLDCSQPWCVPRLRHSYAVSLEWGILPLATCSSLPRRRYSRCSYAERLGRRSHRR